VLSDVIERLPVVSATHRRWLRPGDVAFTAAAVGLAVWAAFQNLYRLAQPFVLFDEPTYATAAWRYIHFDVLPPPSGHQPNLDNFEHPPLAKLLFGLAQLIPGHPDITADRAVAATCTLLTAAVLGIWLARAAGRWVGLLVAAFAALLPVAVAGADARFGRYGMLDPVAELFMVLSLALGWAWLRHRGPASWRYAVLTGLAVGCATAVKENGVLGIVGPVLLMAFLAGRDRRLLLTRCAQALAAVLTTVLVFLGVYLPFGDPFARIAYLYRFLSWNASLGHLVGFAGQVSAIPPWWTNLWFAGSGLGATLMTVLALTALAAVLLCRDVLVAWLLAALAAPLVFHLFVATVMLNYYWTLWTPAFLTLSALGVQATVARFRTASHPIVPVVVAALLLATPFSSAVAESRRVAALKPEGTMVLSEVMRTHDLHGPVVFAGLGYFEIAVYNPRLTLAKSGLSPQTAGADTVVLGRPRCRVLVDSSVRALVAVNVRAGRLHRVYRDSRIDVYAADGLLLRPTQADIKAQPPGALSDHC
jgi:4-amino-4-deoxy-L-arabinose transferase-like glycosyltransferase